MNRGIDFFKDEVRNGFYVPTVIKQVWAAGLDVLWEIDRICEKYQIKYFAEWGTFLGAVRHNGYIPWDDDIDICMMRQDYIRFLEIAGDELPQGYGLHNFSNRDDHWFFTTSVVNNSHVCFDVEYLKEHNNFPWISCVDIYVEDYLYKDEEREAERDKEILRIVTLADSILDHSYSKEVIHKELLRLKEKHGLVMSKGKAERDMAVELYYLAEKIMAEVNEEQADRVGQIFPYIIKGRKGEKKEIYDSIIRVPFEDTTIPIIERYDEALNYRFKEYKKPIKRWGGHIYPYFEGQKIELKEMTGLEIPEFSFEKSMICRENVDKSDSLKQFVIQSVDAAERVLDKINDADLLQELQQLMIEIGTAIERVRGENDPRVKRVVSELEGYCESIYQVSEGEQIDLAEAFCKLKKCIWDNIIKRKEVLFLTTGAKEWSKLIPFYDYWKEKPDVDLSVIVLPVAKKDPLGRIISTEEEIERTMQNSIAGMDIITSSWDQYDLTERIPDIIYFQNPYDDQNPYLTVPDIYYAKNLQRYTEKLVYVPALNSDEFGEDDTRDLYSLKYYITAPGIMYADVVYTASDNLREQYYRKLCEFSNQEVNEYWDNKLVVYKGIPIEEADK